MVSLRVERDGTGKWGVPYVLGQGIGDGVVGLEEGVGFPEAAEGGFEVVD